MSELCEERHENCKTRMKSQSEDIKIIFREKASRSTLFWTLGIFFVLIIGGYGYTKTVADDVSQVVTKTDMQTYQKVIVDAIKAAK